MKVPHEVEDLLEDIIFPIRIAYFKSIDDNLNLKCQFSNIDYYEHTKIFSLYSIKPILRIFLLKSKIIQEEVIEEIFENERKEICIILKDDTQTKDFLILNIENLEYLKDHSLSKVLSKNIDDIHHYLEKATSKDFK